MSPLISSTSNKKVGMIKAFLSHSSIDKTFILSVATRLGRRQVNLDVWEFESGKKFMESIRESLAASTVFVLFVSESSLKSLWVTFEISEADELLRSEILKSSLVLIIDPKVTPKDLPAWMQRSSIQSILSPNAASRLIEFHINKFRGVEQEALFIGREVLLSEFSERLIPAPEKLPPHLLLVGGLPGVGRRTFLERAIRDSLSVRVGAIFTMQPTDGLDALHLALLDELGAFDSRDQIAAAVQQFLSSTPAEQAKTVAQMLASAALGNVAPVIVDQGGLLDSSGKYTPEILSVIDALKKYPNVIVGFVHTRRPTMSDFELSAAQALYTRIPPLDIDSTKRLLNQSLRRAGVQANSDQINELAGYLEGYPPSVNIAVSMAREYGLPSVLADKSGLMDFQLRTFAGILEKLRLEEIEWTILRLLAAEPVLPFSTIAAAIGKSENESAKSLRRLTDLNLVLPSGINFQIAFPVKFAVQAIRGHLTSSEFGTVANHLKATYWDTSEKVPSYEIIQATVHAVLRSDTSDLTNFKGLILPSMLFRAAKDNYDRGGQEAWERARRLLEELIKVDSGHKQARILLFKTQVRLNDWKGAQNTLAFIQNKGFPEQHFLNGFLVWKQREFAKAVTAFRNALALGQNSIEVYHGLASCLFRLDNLAEAEKVIQEGLGPRRPNSLLLDLAAQIAIARGNYDAAESYIDKLRRFRADVDYHHRYATLLNAKKQFAAALPHAEKAVQGGGKRRFEVEATLIDTLIELGSFPRANRLLEELDKRERFSGERDVRLGLRCKLYLREKNWRQAEIIWNELVDKLRPVHLALRQEILQQKIDDLTTTPGVRAAAKAELAKIKSKDASNQISLFAVSDAAQGETVDEPESTT